MDMKKLALLLSLLLAVTLAACANEKEAQISSADSAKISELVGSEILQISATITTEAAITTAAVSESSAPEEQTLLANDSVSVTQENQTDAGEQTTVKKQPTPEAPPQTSPPEEISIPIVIEPSPAPTPPTPTPEPPQTPAEPPKPKTAYDAPYDIAQMCADAKAYGESIGMTWSEPLTTENCSWESPGHTYSDGMSGERLKEAIQSGIRRVKHIQEDNKYNPGEFHFKLLFVPDGSEYVVYWLMG
jgi:hypothetical protein